MNSNPRNRHDDNGHIKKRRGHTLLLLSALVAGIGSAVYLGSYYGGQRLC